MKRPIFWIGLLLIAMLMAACAPATPAATSEPEVTTAPTEVAEETAEPTEATTTEPSALGETVTIGVAFALSGPAAVYGESQRNAVELALQQINDSDYLGETELVAIYEDTTGTPEGAIPAITKLVEEDQVVAIIGPTLSREAFSADPIAQEAGIPVLGVSNTATGITEMGDFVFRNSLPESSVIPGTIAQSTEILGLESVGLLYGNDDDFTKSAADIFRQELEANGVTVAIEETFATGDDDFNAQLTNIIAENPDAIVVSALAAEATLIITQARAQGYEGAIIGGNGFNSPAIIANVGEDVEGLIVGAAWNIASADPMSVAFTEAYQAAYGKAPDQFAAQAFTGAWLIATAIRDANSTDPTAIRDALAAIHDMATPLGMFSFDENRDPVHEPVVQIVRDGQFAVLSEENAGSE